MNVPMHKPRAAITDWQIVGSEDRGYRLTGRISGHPEQPRFRHEFQITSLIVDNHAEEGWVETENTIYVLDRPYYESRAQYAPS